jgi:hypothetical protein
MEEASQGSKEKLQCILHVGENDSCEFSAELLETGK